ncbi:hypothetical protein ABT285_36360 [Streptomyces microflavus]|uniref:hypothetical protein n=1 Tax=Streptomyces microflavus TaxID=1919 RepID=UPI00331DDA85
MDSTDGLQAPCNCGALGDHPSNPDCTHTSMVEIEFTGRRSACLDAIGFLRTGYRVTITHEWQDPNTEEWAFKADAYRKFTPPLPAITLPEPPTPEAAVLTYLNDRLGLEIGESDLHVLTGLDHDTLTTTLTALASTGEIEHISPGLYRKNM